MLMSYPSFEEDPGWSIALTPGDVMNIHADGLGEEGSDEVFNVSAGDGPPKIVECARVPLSFIQDYVGVGGVHLEPVFGVATDPMFPCKWTLTCEGGHVVTIWADETHEDGDSQVFTVRLGGERNEQAPFARLPRRLIVALEREPAR